MCHIGISSAKLEKINDICKYYIAFFVFCCYGAIAGTNKYKL